MELYTIKEDYINFLKNFSENVKFNKGGSRPYVGIVLQINGHDYFAPLGSPKPKHIKMKETSDFIKINNGNLGIINLNNMIPVLSNNVVEINIRAISDKKYATLLDSQIRWIERNNELLISKSFKLYKIITEKENTIFHKRSNNFKLLEEKSKEYEKNLEKEKITVVLLNDKPYNPLTGKAISLCPGSQFPDKYKSAAWLSKGQILKNQDKITIKDCEIPSTIRLFSRNAEKQIVMKDILFYNTEQLSIDKELIKKFKEPIKTVEKEPVIKEKDRGWER